MTDIYVSLGSNLGDRAGNLILGLRGMLEAGLTIEGLSSIYETEPVETFSQPVFLNMVAKLGSRSPVNSKQVLARLMRIEYALGRTRRLVKGPRPIDLDLLLYGDEIQSTEFLTLPHPRLHKRRFVLAPLAQLAPQLIHPILGLTIAALLDQLQDNSAVKVWRP